MEDLYLFHQDQDKVRPLSRLANLAITITDVQDMDPIFTNLPYSTNIEEDVPLVSNRTLQYLTSYRLPLHYLHTALMKLFSLAKASQLLACPTNLSHHLSFGSTFPLFILCGSGAREIWLKQRPQLCIMRAGYLTCHPPSPPPHSQLNTALQMLAIVITVGDLHPFRDGGPLAKVTVAVGLNSCLTSS